jgi:DNA-binding CsgD family transcriptional regulator
MTRLATFGRVDELAAIEAFLEPVCPEPSALQIAGAAGIGKTTLLRHATATASRRGFTVLRGVASQADSSVSLAVLADVLGEVVDSVQDELAAPQARALDIALLRSDARDGTADRRAIATAALETIRAASRAGRVLIAIDDLQWVDESSAHALAFALRRLEREPVLVAATFRRGEGPDPLALARLFPTLERLDVGPLDVRSLRRMLEDRQRLAPSLAGVRRLAAVTGGNPLFALELSRSMGEGELPPGEMPDPPTDLVGALRGRLSRLPRPIQESLLTLAAIGRPTSELAHLVPGGSEAIGHAEQEGLLEIAGRQVSFTHPLYASTVYAMATQADRRAVHRRLADASANIEERARHLALAAEDADSSVAVMLDHAADAALARGAPDAAAELTELAIRLTPATAPEAIPTRTTALSEFLFQAGDTDRAKELLEGVAGALRAGPKRADALYRLALFACNDIPRARNLLQHALEDLGDRSAPELRARIFTELAWGGILGGDLRDALEQSESACAAAVESRTEVAVGLAHTASAYARFLAGLSADAALDQAEAMTDALHGIDRLILPRTARGALAMWAGDLDDARVHLEHDHREITERGQLSLLWEVLVYLAELEVRAGDLKAAAAYAAEGLDSLVDAGLEQAMEVHLWSTALVAAHHGEVERARAHAGRALELAEAHEDVFHVLTNRSVLGFVELSLGNPEAAERWFEPLEQLTDDMGLEEPGAFPYVPDEVEALVLTGDLDRACALLDRFERQAQARNRVWALATAARCRGLTLAAQGDTPAALAALDEALDLHSAVPQPFDHGRTLLIQGRILRRSKRKAPARASLEQGLDIFRGLGASLWVSQAEDELSRIGGRAPSRDELTATERQVAELAAQGKTNREVAAALFMSANTVNANLKRVYRKLGLRSRTELAARLTRER